MTEKSKLKSAEPNPMLKLALELGPLLVFFFANARGEWLAERSPSLATLGGPIFIATALFMVATALSLTISWLWLRKLPIMPMVSGVIVFVFGALTLYLQDQTFIKMKPTIVNTLFGLALIGGLFFGKSLLGYVFDSAFKLDSEGWRKLTIRWGIFFFVLALLNEVVWRAADAYYLADVSGADAMKQAQDAADDFWVAFKVWGIMPITFLFTLSQMPLILRHSQEEQDAV